MGEGEMAGSHFFAQLSCPVQASCAMCLTQHSQIIYMELANIAWASGQFPSRVLSGGQDEDDLSISDDKRCLISLYSLRGPTGADFEHLEIPQLAQQYYAHENLL